MKDSTTFHWDGKLGSAMEVRERPRSSGECEGSRTQWGVLVSWLAARRITVATVRLQAYILQWEKNWWESLDLTQAAVEERGEVRELSAEGGDMITITALFSNWRHPQSRAGNSLLRATLSLVSAGWILGPKGKKVSIISSFSQWTLWTWPYHGVPSQNFVPLRVPITSQQFPHSHVCSQTPSVYCQILVALRSHTILLRARLQHQRAYCISPIEHSLDIPKSYLNTNYMPLLSRMPCCPLRKCHPNTPTRLLQKPESQPHLPLQPHPISPSIIQGSFPHGLKSVFAFPFPLLNSVPHICLQTPKRCPAA